MSKSKEFTVMFLSEKSGRHFTIKMGLFTGVMIVVLLIGFVSVATFSFSGYWHLFQENKMFKVQITEQEKALKDLTEESKESALYKKWADNIIFRRLNFKDATGSVSNVVPENTLDGEIPSKSSQRYPLLDIDEFAIRRINLDLDFEVSFKLINRSRGIRKISGYIYFIAGNSEVVPVIYDSWPKVEILDGMPQDYKKGEKFSIRYMKNIKGRMRQPDIGPKFNRVDLIAFSEDGKVIMKKGFYIERLLKQSPYE
jgi:hypothetical protein